MRRQLVIVHGRSQENKDSVALKQEWLTAFRKGLAGSNLQIPIPESDIKFPYYGQTLFDRVTGVDPDEVAQIIVRGAKEDESRRVFLQGVLDEVLKKNDISDAKVAAIAGGNVVERGIQNTRWVLSALRAIDTYVPGGSGAAVALITNDVYQYLRNPGIRDDIDAGVREAFSPDVPMVVVSHSLGTIVSYNLLGREGKQEAWEVPLFMTLGCPLGISMIRDALAPIKAPACVESWVNALDPADVVALYPLDKKHFNVRPPIENLTHVHNGTDNRHGIAGYLDDREVAKRIHDALVA